MTASSTYKFSAPASSFDKLMGMSLQAKPMAPLPLVRPQSLLLYPDVLVRASLAETLMQRQARAQSLQSPPTALAKTTMAFAINYNSNQKQQQALQQKLQQELQRELHMIQASPVSVAGATSQLADASTEDKKNAIIGMGICIPKTSLLSSSSPPKPQLAKRQTHQGQQSRPEAIKKMMMYGNPLRAPPPLAKKIYKRRAVPVAPSAAAPQANKKRKVVPEGEPLAAPRCVSLVGAMTTITPPPVTKTTKTLSADELEFIQAAQRLQHSPPSSPKTSSYEAPPLVVKALKRPPPLGQ